jgi:hypothetical protein
MPRKRELRLAASPAPLGDVRADARRGSLDLAHECGAPAVAHARRDPEDVERQFVRQSPHA